MGRAPLKQRNKQAKGVAPKQGEDALPIDEIEQEKIVAELRQQHRKDTKTASRHGNLVMTAAFVLNIVLLGRILFLNDTSDFSGSKALFGSNQPVLLIFQLVLLLAYIQPTTRDLLRLPDLTKSQPIALFILAVIPIAALFQGGTMIQVGFWSVPFIAAFWRLSVIREDKVMEAKLEALDQLKYKLKGA